MPAHVLATTFAESIEQNHPGEVVVSSKGVHLARVPEKLARRLAQEQSGEHEYDQGLHVGEVEGELWVVRQEINKR